MPNPGKKIAVKPKRRDKHYSYGHDVNESGEVD